MSKDVVIGPWPLGEDNVHVATDDVFQQSKRKPTQRLRRATDVDLRTAGDPVTRPGLTHVLGVANILELCSAYGLLVAHIDSDICLVDLTNKTYESIYSGVSTLSPVKFHAAAGQIWWTDGSVTGRILPDTTVLNWGAPVPQPPWVTPIVGGMCPGKYQVAVSYVDAAGVEHVVSDSTDVVLGGANCNDPAPAAGRGFRIDIPPGPWAGAAAMRLYISEANGSEPQYVMELSPSDFPINVVNGGQTPWSDQLARTQGLSPPPAGDGIASYAGYMMVWVGNGLFPSYGANHHVFNLATDALMFPSDIRAVAGLDDGMWVATKHGLFWVSGSGAPSEWVIRQRCFRPYAAGSIIVPGDDFQDLKEHRQVAVFVCNDGVVVGLPNGEVVYMTKEHYHFSFTTERVRFARRRQRGMRQLLFCFS
jgi:hypothetical protein